MAERDRCQPVDAEVDLACRLLATGDVEIAAARCAAADEHGIEALRQQIAHRVDAMSSAELDAERQDVAGLLVDHLFRQTEARNLRADEAAGADLAIEDGHLVAERREVACDRQRGRAGAHAGDAATVGGCDRGKPAADVVLVIRRNALQTTDGDRFRLGAVVLLDPAASAGRFAGPIAGATEDAGKDVGDPVDHVGVAVTPLGNEPDVLRHRCVGRTGPLAIDDLVEIVRISRVRGFHASPPSFLDRSSTLRISPWRGWAVSESALCARHLCRVLGQWAIDVSAVEATKRRSSVGRSSRRRKMPT